MSKFEQPILFRCHLASSAPRALSNDHFGEFQQSTECRQANALLQVIAEPA